MSLSYSPDLVCYALWHLPTQISVTIIKSALKMWGLKRPGTLSLSKLKLKKIHSYRLVTFSLPFLNIYPGIYPFLTIYIALKNR